MPVTSAATEAADVTDMSKAPESEPPAESGAVPENAEEPETAVHAGLEDESEFKPKHEAELGPELEAEPEPELESELEDEPESELESERKSESEDEPQDESEDEPEDSFAPGGGFISAEVEETDGSERRRHERKTVIEAAVIAAGTTNIPCAILDLSESGAMLLVSSAELEIPETFMLRPLDGEEHNCVLRWRDADKVGLEFT